MNRTFRHVWKSNNCLPDSDVWKYRIEKGDTYQIAMFSHFCLLNGCVLFLDKQSDNAYTTYKMQFVQPDPRVILILFSSGSFAY